jgi:hypothetical protein
VKRPFHRVLADRWPIAPGFLAHPTGTILFPKTKNIAGANVEAPPRREILASQFFPYAPPAPFQATIAFHFRA